MSERRRPRLDRARTPGAALTESALRRSTSRPVAVAVLVALLGGLGSLRGAASPRSGPDWLVRGRPVTGSEVVLPFDAYRFDRSDRQAITRATHLLVTGCMRFRGFAAFAGPPGSPGARPGPPTVTPNSRRYGVVDLAVAARYGYHFPTDTAGRAAAYRRWYGGLADRERIAFEGRTGAGGCVARADRALRTGIGRRHIGWFTPLDFHSLDSSAADRRVRSATARWRGCMSDRGMRYTSPRDAIADPRWHLNTPSPSRREIATATADVRCKHLTGLARTWLTTERNLQRDLIVGRTRDFAALGGGNTRYVANARAVLANRRPS